MRKTIDMKWLAGQGACSGGRDWFKAQSETDPITIIRALKTEHPDWAIWLFCHLVTKDQNVRLAIYAARMCLPTYESRYPDDRRPREAVLAAARWRKNPSRENQSAAESAESAAWSAWSAAWSAARSAGPAESAAESAWSAESAAESAWSAARSAAGPAESAAESAWSAAWSAARSAARSAAWSAARSAGPAESAAYHRLINYAIRILREGV